MPFHSNGLNIEIMTFKACAKFDACDSDAPGENQKMCANAWRKSSSDAFDLKFGKTFALRFEHQKAFGVHRLYVMASKG